MVVKKAASWAVSRAGNSVALTAVRWAVWLELLSAEMRVESTVV